MEASYVNPQAPEGIPLQQTPPPNNNQWWRLPLILVFIFLLIVMAGGVYLLVKQNKIGLSSSPQSSDKPQAKEPTPEGPQRDNPIVFKTKVFKGTLYSFEYPEDWNIATSDDKSVSLKKEAVTLTISTEELQSNTTLNKLLESLYLKNDDQNSFDTIKQSSTQITLDEEDAIAVKVPGAENRSDEGVVTIHEGTGYHISIVGSKVEGSAEAYHMVINTFKFNK